MNEVSGLREKQLRAGGCLRTARACSDLVDGTPAKNAEELRTPLTL
jgi:hypothetical protein